MQLSPGVAALCSFSGAFLLSLGMTLQKQHIGWLDRPPRSIISTLVGNERKLSGRLFADFLPWLFGFILMNLVPILNYFALTGLPTNVVGVSAGLSVAFTAILAKVMLKEKLGRRRVFWTILLLAAIAAAGFLGTSGASGGKGLSHQAIMIFFCLPVGFGIILLFFRNRLKGTRHSALVAAVSGCLGGFMVFPMRGVQIDSSGSWLLSPYLYLYSAASIASFAFQQIAYKDGELASTGPALYGMQVLWPAIGTHFIFGTQYSLVQAAAFAMVALCVGVIAGIKPPAKAPLLLEDLR